LFYDLVPKVGIKNAKVPMGLGIKEIISKEM
jgi:hypothetical protein